jgi:uncharacterized membrane protein
MKFAREFLANALVGGVLIVLPIYLAVLVLLKGMQSVAALVRPFTMLLPAFIIEELEDGRFTVFVPSVPTPFAGAVYILGRERVHPVDVPFTQAISSISRWGSGSKDLAAAMTKAEQ